MSEPAWRLLGQRVRSLVYLTVILTVASSTAHALNPARAITQYVHTVWNRDQGVPAGIYDMAQDHNGFIWLASRNGLFRFDGQTFERVDSATSSQQKLIFTLTATRDGSMWIGYERGGLAVYRNGSIENVPDAGDGSPIIRIVQTRDGTMWAAAGGSRDMPLLRQSNGKFIPVNASWGLPKDQSIDLISASDGSLWMSTFVHPTIFRLAPGSHRFERINVPVRGRAAISEDPEGRVWVSDELGTRMVWKDGHVRSGSRFYPTPSFDRGAYATWDPDGSMWGSRSSKGGIFRLTNPFRNKQADYETSPGTVEHYSINQGLSGKRVAFGLVDREGSIWLYSASTLDRFGNSAVVIEPALVNPPPYGDVLTSTRNGDVYVAEKDVVYRIRPNGRPVAVLRNTGDPYAICHAPDGSAIIVFAKQTARVRGSAVTWLGYPPAEPGDVHDCAVDGHSQLWISTEQSGLFTLRGRRWQKYTFPTLSEPKGTKGLATDAAGKLIVVRSSGILSLLDSRGTRDFRVGPGSAVGKPQVFSSSAEKVLIGTTSGIARLRGSKLEMSSIGDDTRLHDLNAIVETPDGETWMKGRNGLIRVATHELDASFVRRRIPFNTLLLDRADGADEGSQQDSHLNGARGGDGRLWFSGTSGTRWLNPKDLYRNTVPPGVVISRLVASGRRYLDPTAVTLAAGTSSIEIGFAVLNFKKQLQTDVRYRLKGVDPNWINPGARRTAFYTNLGPGKYVFEVKAANEDGVLSDHVAMLSLQLPATFVQSILFKIIIAAILAILLAIGYQLRVRQVAHHTKQRMRDRMAERERIAGDLHDTLLQGFQGMILRFHALRFQTVDRQSLDHALDQAQGQLDEGRRGLYQLRATDLSNSLVNVTAELGEELSRESGIEFQFAVHGIQHDLESTANIESERIAGEAIRNAFAHSQARTVSASITFEERMFQIEVRDDGQGIPVHLLRPNGRSGHFGLSVMRERAQRMKADLTIETGSGEGTRVTLRLKGRRAYERRPISWSHLWG